MKNSSPLRVYALAICAYSLIALAIGVGSALYQAVRLYAPSMTLSAKEYRRASSNESFLELALDPRARENMQGWSEEEVTAAREEFAATALGIEQRSARQILVTDAIMMLVMLSLLGIHLRLLQRIRITAGG